LSLSIFLSPREKAVRLARHAGIAELLITKKFLRDPVPLRLTEKKHKFRTLQRLERPEFLLFLRIIAPVLFFGETFFDLNNGYAGAPRQPANQFLLEVSST